MQLRIVFALALACFGCGAQDPMTPPDGVVHDACGPLTVAPAADVTDAQREGIARAIGDWNGLGFTQLGLEGAGAPVALSFASAAAFFHGFYDPETGEVIINRSVQDPLELQVVIAHELGHAMGLPHVALSERASVMNPGNVTLAPTADDSANVKALCPLEPLP